MADMSMNSNLMFRSMFFMNDEATRHFLAPPLPPIQPCDIQSDYFQKKLMSQVSSSSTPGSSSVTTSSTNTGNISASTTNTNTTGTTTTGTNTTNPSNHQTTSSVGGGLPTPENKLTITLPKQRPHTCEECGKTFLMKHHLLTHMRVHTGERPYICPECGKSFALKHCLSTHLLLHTADRPYKCNECNKSFTLKHHLVSHERVHTRDRPFECTECGQRFPQKRHLSTHIKFHSGERPFSCQVCGESFSREEHLVMHSRFHGGLSPYNCPDCGAGFLRKFELVNHERQHGRNPESCPNCGKEFLQKRTLLVHMRSCNGNGPISLATSQQSFSPPRFSESGSPPRFSDNSPPRFNDGMTQRFPNNSNSPRYSENSNQFRFSEGQMRFNNDNTPSSSPMPPMQAQKDKVCKECGETFASVEGLALHLRLHFGDHSFLADICSLAASLKQTAVNVAASLKKTHICTDCGRGFTQRHGLFQHRQRYANGSCKEKPFACEKCGKSFAQKNHLMLHERQHMDLPPRNLKISQKCPQPNPENVEQMDTLNETGHQVDRTHQGERTSQSSEIAMQNHSDHQRINLLNRHASKSTDNIPQNEKGNINMMMQANHPNHQRELLNRHSSDSSTDRSSQMQQDLLNRHTSESSDSTSQSEKGNINMLMQSNHTDHQRELLNRHPSESSSDRSLQMQQGHSDSHLPHPVALVQGVNILSGNRVNQSGNSGIQQNSSNRAMMPHHHHMGGAHLMLHEQQHMDLPPRNLKNSQKGPQPNPENVEQMDTSSETGHQVDRTRQGERTSQSSEMVMQNHSDHQRIDLLNRHASKSSDSIPQNEKGNMNMMMQANHPNHQRELLNRHSSDSSTDRSSQMQQDLLNRHTSESSDSTSQSEKGNINMLMQSNHSDHQRELLNRHPSESSSERSLQMQQGHSDSHLPHPVALVRGVNIHSGNRVNQSGNSGIQQNSSNRAMMPHHHHMGGAQSSEQIMPCLHPVPSKQY